MDERLDERILKTLSKRMGGLLIELLVIEWLGELLMEWLGGLLWNGWVGCYGMVGWVVN